MSKLSWTQACCETCWINREGEFEDYTPEEIQSFIDDGLIEPEEAERTSKLVSLRIPTMVRQREGEKAIEQCGFCGNVTFVGIFVREDPAKVPFPREE